MKEIYHEYYQEILDRWDTLNENVKNSTIDKELIPYYQIWNKLSASQQEYVCRKPDLDYENYWNLLEDRHLKRMILGFNETLDLKKCWDVLNNQDRLFVIRHNKNFDYQYFWKDLNIPQRDIVIEKHENFDIDKYWSDLNPSQISSVIRYHYKKLDINKHWNDFLNEHKVTLIINNILNLNNNDKLQECVDMVINNNYIDSVLLALFNMFKDEISKKLNKNKFEYDITNIDIEKITYNKQFYIKILQHLDMFNISDMSQIVEKYNRTGLYVTSSNIYLYKEGSFSKWLKNTSCYLYCVKDIKLILREKKLKRVLNDEYK